MRKQVLAVVTALFWPAMAPAEVPKVAVDIAPVQSLAARVMDGLGAPALVVRPGASPHDYAMRPSEAAALDRADVILFVSGNLTRWFEQALEPLAGKARTIELLESPGTLRLAFREDALFGEEEAGDDHGHESEGDHIHFGPDPHGWLDPENARVWLGHIAEALAEADPENAATYRANAEAGRAEIDAAAARARELLAPVVGKAFFVHHDGFHYFENRFGLHAAGAVARGDAAQPGPRRVAELQAAVAETGAVCVFSEPQLNPAILATVFEGRTVRRAVLDPLGGGLEPGPGLYPALIEALAAEIAACLAE